MPTVLLLEDDPIDEELTRMLLAEAHSAWEIVLARRVKAALARLAEGGVDVVLMDLSIPDGSGAAGVRAVVGGAAPVPVLVLTGSIEDERLVAAALAAGARACLMKGAVAARELDAALRDAVGGA